MGMDYYIMPKEDVACTNEFPEKLSQFFEQVGGYHEFAEASQISVLLSVDLTIFQDIDYDVNEEEEDELHWHPIDEYLKIIDAFIEGIRKKPNYHEQVRHEERQDSSGIVAETLRIAQLQGIEQEQQWNLLKDKYERRYPPDYRYLSSGQIIEDLHTLQRTLKCYVDNGVKEARLFYM